MNNSVLAFQENALAKWAEQNPDIAARGIDAAQWSALESTVYPGAKRESILLAVDYCLSRKLDVMLKPVHLVPMQVKNAQTGQSEWRDVPMPGVGLYRIQAERTGNYAGADAPEMGPDITKTFRDKNGKEVTVTFPEWCKYTVHKLMGDRLVSYTALEYWEENYATDSSRSNAPNKMWQKRVRGQIAKCAEAQALRKAWPEIGQEPTAEEMEGKAYATEKDVTPNQPAIQQDSAPQLPHYPEDRFKSSFNGWALAVKKGQKTPEDIITMVSSKWSLTEDQKQTILSIPKGVAQ